MTIVGGDVGPPPVGLSERERDIVLLIAVGLTNSEISEQLFLSVNTVKTYIRSAYRKMGVESRTQALLWVYEQRLLPPPGSEQSSRSSTSKPAPGGGGGLVAGGAAAPSPTVRPYP